MPRVLVITGLLCLGAAGIFSAGGLPLEARTMLGLAGLQLGVALVLAVVRSRRSARRSRIATREANVAAVYGLWEGRALTQSLLEGQVPDWLTVWGLVMGPGESPYLDVAVHYSRFSGRSALYRRSSAYFLGGGPGAAFAAGCLLLGDSLEQKRAVRAAAPRWRGGQQTRAVLTDRRLLVLADNQWVEFRYDQVSAFYPDPWSWRVVLEFAGACAPLCVTGPATPSVMALLCWALHGVEGLRTHPSLQPLR